MMETQRLLLWSTLDTTLVKRYPCLQRDRPSIGEGHASAIRLSQAAELRCSCAWHSHCAAIKLACLSCPRSARGAGVRVLAAAQLDPWLHVGCARKPGAAI